MKILLITGGTVFIGSNFIQYMITKYPECFIMNLDKTTCSGNLVNLKNMDFHNDYMLGNVDITNEKLVKKLLQGVEHPQGNTRTIDYVISFAAESHVDRSIHGSGDFIRTNVLGTNILLKAAKDAWSGLAEFKEKRFTHVSTDEVYGNLNSKGKFSETTPYAPPESFCSLKSGCCSLVRSF